MNFQTKLLLSAALFAGAATSAQSALTPIASVPASTPYYGYASTYYGQSVTVTGAAGVGSYNNIYFSFLGYIGTPVAAGTLYVFDQEYSGSVGGLASAGALASATGASGAYSFSNLTLDVGKTYYFYASQIGSSAPKFASYDALSGGHAYFASGSDGFGGISYYDMEFTMSGSPLAAPAPAPEPASWAMMLAGFGLVGGAVRRGRATRVRFA